MTERFLGGMGLALCLATLASASGEGMSPTYLLRNARLDGTRMSIPPDRRVDFHRTYRLNGIHLGSPLQGTAEGDGILLQLLAGAWSWRSGDPHPDMGCLLYTPNYCSGPGTWDLPPSGSPPVAAPLPPAGHSFWRRLKLSGRLYGPEGSPVGEPGPDSVDLRIILYPASTGSTAVYSEAHTVQGGNPVEVDEGRFILHLGADMAGGDLSAVLAAHENLFAEFQVGEEVLEPRLPVTGGMLSGTPRVLSGEADPAAAEPPGTYYRNTVAGSTWIRMTSSWVRIAP